MPCFDSGRRKGQLVSRGVFLCENLVKRLNECEVSFWGRTRFLCWQMWLALCEESVCICIRIGHFVT